MLGEQTGIFKGYTLLACMQTSPTCIFFVAVRKEMVYKMLSLIVFQPRSQGIQL